MQSSCFVVHSYVHTHTRTTYPKTYGLGGILGSCSVGESDAAVPLLGPGSSRGAALCEPVSKGLEEGVWGEGLRGSEDIGELFWLRPTVGLWAEIEEAGERGLEVEEAGEKGGLEGETESERLWDDWRRLLLPSCSLAATLRRSLRMLGMVSSVSPSSNFRAVCTASRKKK